MHNYSLIEGKIINASYNGQKSDRRGLGVHNLDKTMGNSKISVDNLLDNRAGLILLK